MHVTRDTWTTRRQTKYDSIDKEATEIMLISESNCVKTFRFITPWSVPLIKANRGFIYWNLRLSMENGRKVASSVLETARVTADIADFTSSKIFT